METLSVFLVDDHQMFCEGLRSLLNNYKGINEIREAADGNSFLSKIKEQKPDIVFMDISMPGMDGIEATREALKIYPELNVVALSMYGDENYYTRMIDAGAKGFILKNSGFQDVEMAIKQVMSGMNYFSQEILSRLIRGMGKKKHGSNSTELSEREQEGLYSICKGYSNQEIADSIYLSKRTVDKHRENLLYKTHSKNTAGLVIYAIKHGIIEI